MAARKPPKNVRRILRKERAPADLMQPIGRSGLRQFNGYLQHEFLQDLRGQRGAQRYHEMRENSAILGAMFGAIEAFFLQTAFPVIPSLAGDPEAEACAAFIQECLDDMDHSFQVLLSEFLTAPVFGHSEHEVVLKLRGGDNDDPAKRSRFTDGRMGWRRIALRSQTSIVQWLFDPADPDTPVAFVQQVEGQGFQTRVVPLARCVHFRMSQRLNNPEGRSLLRNCHRAYTFSEGLEEIEAIHHERYLGVPIVEVPAALLDSSTAESAVTDDLMDALSQFRFGERSCLIVPAEEEGGRKTGFKTRLERPTGAGSDMDATIQRWDQRMAQTLLMDWLTIGHEQNGSRAVHGDKTSMFGRSLCWLADLFCMEFTKQAIWPLCRVNGFREDAWPQLGHGPVVPVGLSEFCEAVNKLVGAGALTASDELENAALRMLDQAPRDLDGEDAPG